MAVYSIGDVAGRCGINPVTLRAWQRRYGLLKPQRSEGGHRQFDEQDIERIEEIKRWIKSGVPVGKIRALLEKDESAAHDDWPVVQEEIMALLRQVNPEALRNRLAALRHDYTASTLIDNLFIPVRLRLNLDPGTAGAVGSLLDGVLIELALSGIREARNSPGKNALILGWCTGDRLRIWLEAWRLSQQGWHIDVLAEPLDIPRPELFPGQPIFVWTDSALTRRQQDQLAHWHEQGYNVTALNN